ncbi:hypothetical protein ACTNBU_01395, partial [Dysosmobacter sp. HCP28S3_G4]
MYYIEDKDQLVIEDFTMPFGGELDPENRWVRLAGIMPWDYIEEIYLQTMNTETGRRANGNTKKQIKEQVPVASKHYAKELMAEVNADREAHGKKPFDDDDDEPPTAPKKRKDNTSKKKLARRKKEKTRTVTKSRTDPDSGLFVKGDHKRQFAYEAHTACDSHGFVLETVVTP